MRYPRPILAGLCFSLSVLATACGDPLELEAGAPTEMVELGLYTISAALPGYPAAVNTPEADVVPLTASGGFDFAVDLDSQGRVVLHPLRVVVTPLFGAHRVGFVKVAGAFDAVERAPVAAYPKDSSLTVLPGEVVVIEAERNAPQDYCSFALNPNIYSKMVVTGVDPATGVVSMTLTVNPNCGFRSFAAGIPRD